MKGSSRGRKRIRPRSVRKPQPARTQPAPPEEPARGESALGSLLGSLGGLTTDLTSSAWRLASRTRDSAARVIARTPEQLRMMARAGESLRDIRKVAGMTATEISAALNLRDKNAWEAIESGREVISFELILRLASLVARNDPLPFVLKYTRTYHPRLWEILHELKIDRLPLQFERERNFINIYRRHDAARTLSDANFDHVLQFTRQAFDLAMQFILRADQPASAESPDSDDEARDDSESIEDDEHPRPAARRAPMRKRRSTARRPSRG
ncbi:MAG: helix-turn-helix transcriptional regulator [Pseudomonadales bacterium]|jgi:transcriptional regulator with XRE-family HTH domain|nr:helix-turn-helix transcriptional regulator [Pseudomonadales bacterium]MCP5319432.1 helix-turn-helix transcriptional regulator [Pseudomonadales bacterium]MCP5336971.1 helix-turn-helix transcriptional regulator [Pseudomonadales bacterium]